MQHMVGVRKRNCLTDFLENTQAFPYASRFRRLLIQALTLHKLHRVKDASVSQRAHVMHRHDARMLKLSDDFCFSRTIGRRTRQWYPQLESL